ncbi:glycosyltransferase [Rhizobium sp. FY34]|uniref:glycosyltransferase n=1 Tax=Rhizobium sp. FY34 TaxID=2562309 RepID=UPI0010C09B77|nr:glycosyltransferase [Rhizobium sp. FY34]
MIPIRVLHVVANLRHGGVQSWILDLARVAADGSGRMDVLAYGNQQWPLSDVLSSLGVTIHGCTRHRNPIALFATLRDIVQRHGPFDAIHCHEMFHNGTLVAMGALLGIPVRVSHAHNSAQATRGSFARRIYNRAMQVLMRRFATDMLAVSSLAGKKLYGANWGRDARYRQVSCGLDFAGYAVEHDRTAVRAEFGIPPDARVIGHAGRFVEQKNHAFLLEVAAVAMARDPAIRLLLVGDGPLRGDMEEQATRIGIRNRTIFTGARHDVPRLMVGAFDLLLLPSLFEGLGLVILEAMAACRPCIISDVVPTEVDVVPALVSRLSLSAPAEAWADAVLAAIADVQVDRRTAIAAIELSDFTCERSYRTMLGIYRKGGQ